MPAKPRRYMPATYFTAADHQAPQSTPVASLKVQVRA